MGTKVHKTNGLNATAATLRPLADRVVAKAVAREEMTKSGIMLPDTAKEKPMRATVVAVGEGRRSRGRDADSARCADRRPDPLRQIWRHRVHARRGRAPHPVGKGHPRRRRILDPRVLTSTQSITARSFSCPRFWSSTLKHVSP